jgi:hypothetical protein
VKLNILNNNPMKVKIINLIAMLVTFAMYVVAQGNNNAVVTESRTSRPYHFIIITGEMNVKLIQDENPGVAVEGNKYQLDNTITIVKNDTLIVYQTNIRKKDSKTFVAINADNLVLLSVNGKSKVDCAGLVHSDYLTIRANNGAIIKIDVRALSVKSEVSNCGFISLAGSAIENNENITGCGIIDSHLLDVVDRNRDAADFCRGC